MVVNNDVNDHASTLDHQRNRRGVVDRTITPSFLVHVHHDVVPPRWHRRPEPTVTPSGAEEDGNPLDLSCSDLRAVARPGGRDIWETHHIPGPWSHHFGGKRLA